MKIMKLLFLFLSISSIAQSKVGTIDIDFIITKMPEITVVQKQLEDYKAELDVDFNKNMKAYNAMVEDYKKNEVNFTIATKQEKQKAILEAENNLGTFQKNGTKLISIRRDELLRPLYQKIGDALGKAAKANAYTQVLQINDSLVYIDNEYDLTIEVLAELGVEIETKN